MIRENNELMEVFDKMRKTYFVNWNKSASLAEREVIFMKMEVLKEIEKEFMAMQNCQLTTINTEVTPQTNKSHYYRYRSLY
jgi:hypothetical protein